MGINGAFNFRSIWDCINEHPFISGIVSGIVGTVIGTIIAMLIYDFITGKFEISRKMGMLCKWLKFLAMQICKIFDKACRRIRNRSKKIPIMRQNSTEFFSERISDAFPEAIEKTNQIVWYERSSEIKKRLQKLLRTPLKYKKPMEGAMGHYPETIPLLLYRGGDPFSRFRNVSITHNILAQSIYRFKHVYGNRFLFGDFELRTNRIAAFHHKDNPKRDFVYIETQKDELTGLSRFYDENDIEEKIGKNGYYRECYGIVYYGLRKKIVMPNGKEDEYRYRFLTEGRYNFILIEKDSPYNTNNEGFLRQLHEGFNKILSGEIDLETFIIKYLDRCPDIQSIP